jgi:hypothetical protein
MTSHPLTTIAAAMGPHPDGTGRVTRAIGFALADFLDSQCRDMAAADEREPGYTDLANRLRNL